VKIARIITLIVFFEICTFAAAAYFFMRPVTYSEYRGDGFTCLVPAGESPMVFEEYGWQKHYFTGKGSLYISHRTFEGTFDEEVERLGRHLHGAAFQKKIAVFDDGWFFLYARGRSRRKYIYLFSVGQEVFWVENATSHSTLLTYKEVADRVVTSLTVNGRNSEPDLPVHISHINREIIRHTQGPLLLFGVIGGIMLIIPAVLAVVFVIAGLPPSLPPGRMPIMQEKNVYITIRGPWKYKGTVGCLVLTPDALTLYCFKRPMLTISKEDIGKISLEETRGKPFLAIMQNGTRFHINVADARMWMTAVRSQLQSM